MRVHNSTRYAAIAALLGGLACAGNKARTEGTDQAAAARDTTTTRDTAGAQTENPPGYRGMERDTTMVPRTGQTASDTFLQKQGQGSPQDTAGYSGIERDTTHRAGVTDSTGFRRDSTGYGADTTGANRSRDTSGTASADSSSYKSNPGALDSTGMSRTGDTTGYRPSQQAGDSTAR
jgi:hypothetical protein